MPGLQSPCRELSEAFGAFEFVTRQQGLAVPCSVEKAQSRSGAALIAFILATRLRQRTGSRFLPYGDGGRSGSGSFRRFNDIVQTSTEARADRTGAAIRHPVVAAALAAAEEPLPSVDSADAGRGCGGSSCFANPAVHRAVGLKRASGPPSSASGWNQLTSRDALAATAAEL